MKTNNEIEKLLIDLINIPSQSGNELEVAKYIESKLAGFAVERQYVSNERFNIIAKKGKSDIWIVVHMDTVPGIVPVKVTATKLYGRGSIDNKGNIAGAIIAGRELSDINLFFTVGEEVDFVGAKISKIKGTAIVLEPTVFKKYNKQCGVISVTVTTKGVAKHSSLAKDESIKATHKLIKILTNLENKKWHCFNVGIINGGVASNITAPSATAEISVRPRTMIEYKNILKVLSSLKKQGVKTMDKFPPYQSEIKGIQCEKEAVSFFSEMSFFKKGILFGVGDIAVAHTDQEYVIRKDLALLPKKLVELVEQISK